MYLVIFPCWNTEYCFWSTHQWLAFVKGFNSVEMPLQMLCSGGPKKRASDQPLTPTEPARIDGERDSRKQQQEDACTVRLRGGYKRSRETAKDGGKENNMYI